MNEFNRGRIEGALAFWRIMEQNLDVAVPSVDSVLELAPGTTKKYLEGHL